MQWFRSLFFAAVAIAAAAPVLSAQQITFGAWQQPFDVSSATFRNDTTLPLGTIYNSITNGVNACTPDGSIGGNASPQLTWSPFRGARSYAVVLFDQTASFTHWGLYNVSPNINSLPADAGVANNNFGKQITNDFGLMEYDGPCPPPGLVHNYVFTVYALDTQLNLPQSTTFPSNAETLFRALIGHVLAQASITGFYASTPQ
ncbi:MAG TPA: YbhB/YbcL family Raf kinase inhibitor-like protein [Acidobacteriaceae bacterium]|jgi:hypothetical protein